MGPRFESGLLLIANRAIDEEIIALPTELLSVSFVSVTQQFNSTTSLGRLTLNILLSFAQFEREIIAERTRDKMSAARRKGKWVGGTPVLGYDVDPAGGRLVVNQKEARRVREIFDLCRRHASLSEAVAELARRRWLTKSWTSRAGRVHRGRPFTRASLRRLLGNPVFVGRVEHRGVIYPGEQPAIVDGEVWQEVNAKLRVGRRARPSAKHVPQNALLSGLLICHSCRQPMVPTYTTKPGRRYRYYVCRSARKNGWKACHTKSVPARLIETSVVEQLRAALAKDERFALPDAHQSDLEANSTEWVRSLVKEVSFDGTTGAVVLSLRSQGDGREN